MQNGILKQSHVKKNLLHGAVAPSKNCTRNNKLQEWLKIKLKTKKNGCQTKSVAVTRRRGLCSGAAESPGAHRKYPDVNAINLTGTLHFNIQPPACLSIVAIYSLIRPLRLYSPTPPTPRVSFLFLIRSRVFLAKFINVFTATCCGRLGLIWIKL